GAGTRRVIRARATVADIRRRARTVPFPPALASAGHELELSHLTAAARSALIPQAHEKPSGTPGGSLLDRPRLYSLDEIRSFAVARSLFAPTTLERAIGRLGFVQADPIRAPARAQDLTLRHRVRNYRSGDLERRYPQL